MTSVLNAVDQRTKLVGENRLELLLFKLGTRHVFAINVFKIKEVIVVPKINAMPGSHSHIYGVTNYRGTSIPIINLQQSIKLTNGASMETTKCNVIITEYNRSIQGFLIGEVLSIINTSWKDIQSPPSSIGKSNYLTAITQLQVDGNDHLVEIIDVEKVLAEIIDYNIEVSKGTLDDDIAPHLKGRKVLVVDDSGTARKQITDTLARFELEFIECGSGLEALHLLQSLADDGIDVCKEFLMMFTDAEMPEMDGYRLTAEVRDDPRMDKLHIALNTSLSGKFNDAMVEKVGCDRFISKFQPDALVTVVQDRMREVLKG